MGESIPDHACEGRARLIIAPAVEELLREAKSGLEAAEPHVAGESGGFAAVRKRREARGGDVHCLLECGEMRGRGEFVRGGPLRMQCNETLSVVLREHQLAAPQIGHPFAVKCARGGGLAVEDAIKGHEGRVELAGLQ